MPGNPLLRHTVPTQGHAGSQETRTHMILKEINLIQSQLQQHKATHGKFTIEVAKQAKTPINRYTC